MRHYTTPEQTFKLMEMGFKKPMWRVARKFDDQPPRKTITSDGVFMTSSYSYEDVFAYSIGELIEMLLSKPHCRVSIYNVGLRQYKVLFKKLINGKFKVLFREVGYEPIDLLFNCIVNLKEE